MSDLYVLVPDRLGVSLVEVGALLERLQDGDALEDAAGNAGIDSVSRGDIEGLARLAARGHHLNDAGVSA